MRPDAELVESHTGAGLRPGQDEYVRVLSELYSAVDMTPNLAVLVWTVGGRFLPWPLIGLIVTYKACRPLKSDK